jgi:hypothetical protein
MLLWRSDLIRGRVLACYRRHGSSYVRVGSDGRWMTLHARHAVVKMMVAHSLITMFEVTEGQVNPLLLKAHSSSPLLTLPPTQLDILMNETEKAIFELGTVATGLNSALTAALNHLRTALGDRAATEMKTLEESFIRDIKNSFKSTGPTPVPAVVMQSSIAKLVAQVQLAFERSKNKGSA